ncbi:hypothetical protein FA95DRAFT_1554110 [Auriscalpium vulgare]|uniref:Uncharacterized protein n=1 Tax=Auriscalpium vulgare TaxID=40419 RepID=A0ACB8S7G8_9AGAM|nr:hypothetical protein FA95DRAFT_1554110 [Auriscalpium vulgare]
MASFNVTADDSSPLITYTPIGAWKDTAAGDPSVPAYSAQSYHSSSAQGASATLSFNGTGIWLFGAKKPNYGTFTISVDGESVQGSAQSTQAAFQQMLGGKSGLPNGSHTVTLTNTGSGASIDLDSVIFETQIGATGSSVSNITTDDSSPSFTYLPTPGAWTTNNLPGCVNDTLHFTQLGGAQVQFQFSGDAVALYGTTSPDHANYTVSVDGATQGFDGGSNGAASILHQNTLLYFGNSLGSGSHVVTLTANPDQAGQADTGKFMDIDAITVYSAAGGAAATPTPGNDNSSPGSSSSTGTQSKSSKTGIIIGVVGGVVVLLLLAILAITLLFRRRRRQRSRMPMQMPDTPSLPFQSITPGLLSRNRFSFGPQAPAAVNPFADPNPFSDPEKAIYTSARVPQPNRNSGLSYYAGGADLPTTPRTSVMRDSYRVDDDDMQVKSGAWATVPARSARPPMLRLPPGGE